VVKYLALSTVIVVGGAIFATAWVHRDLIRIRIGSVYAGSTKPGAPNGPVAGGAAPVRGGASWALSALPDCLIQTSE
jgi:hypothetical protein